MLQQTGEKLHTGRLQTPLTLTQTHKPWVSVLRYFGRASIYVIVAATILLSFARFEELGYQNYLRDQKLDTVVNLIGVRDRIEKRLYERALDITELAAIVSQNLEMNKTEFNLKAIGFVLGNPEVNNVSISKDLVGTMVFPKYRDEELLGRNIASHSNQDGRIQAAIMSGADFITGPHVSSEGTTLITLHRQVFRKNSTGQPVLWGVVSLALDYDKLIEQLDIPALESQYDILIQETDSAEATTPMVLYGDVALVEDNPIRLKIDFPFGDWELIATTDGGWPLHKPDYLWRWYLCLFAALISLILLRSVTKLIERRLQAEKILSTGIEALDHGFVMFDADRRLVAFNEKYKQLAGGSGMVRVGSLYEDIVKANLENGLIPDAVGREAEWYENWSKRLESRSSDNEQVLADGRLIRAYDRPMDDGSVVGLRIDITDLKEAQHQAEAANRAKTDFMGVLSHELRTPLTVILGNAKLAKNIDKLPAYKKLLHRIQEEPELAGEIEPLLEKVSAQISTMMTSLESSGTHLLDLISEILDFAKIDSGSLTLEKEPTTTCEIVRTVIDQMRPTVEHKNLEFITNIEDAPLYVDTKRIQQILFNLIGNASKFTEEGQIALDVYTENSTIVFSVTDTGIGIPDDHLDRVFEAFQQVDLSANRKFNGTGLGLAIARDMANAHAGELTLESKLGHGSKFTLTLPFNHMDAASASDDQSPLALVA